MTTNFKYVQAQTFQLAGAGVSEGDSTMTLIDFKRIDGTLLQITDFGVQGFGTLEPGSGMNEEQISFTGVTQNGDGTATLTGIHTVEDVSPYTQTANFAQGHAGGVEFVISNTAGFYNNFVAVNNDATITAILLVPDPTLPTQIANKEYVDSTAIAGAPAASTTVAGIVLEGTQADVDAKTASRTYMATSYQLFTNPAKMRSTKYNDYVVDSGAANAYVITPVPAITAYVAGQQFTFLVGNTNTGASTLNVNGLGAIAITKNVSSPLSANNLTVGAIATVSYDGTNMQLSTAGVSTNGYTNGTTTKNAADASATQTIAHGLGSTPKSIEVICSLSFISTGTSVTYLSARSFYNGSTQSSQSNFFDGSGGTTVVTDNSTFSLNSNNASSSSNWTVGTITFDATNIYIAWVKTGSASGTYQLLWKANT